MDEPEIVRQAIPLEDFHALCASVGWGKVPADNFETAVARSIACVHARLDGKIVGFARLVGDVGMYNYVQDLIVDADFQKRGIGARLLQELHDIVRGMKPASRKIMLIAADDVVAFYTKHGYADSKPASKILSNKTHPGDAC